MYCILTAVMVPLASYTSKIHIIITYVYCYYYYYHLFKLELRRRYVIRPDEDFLVAVTRICIFVQKLKLVGKPIDF